MLLVTQIWQTAVINWICIIFQRTKPYHRTGFSSSVLTEQIYPLSAFWRYSCFDMVWSEVRKRTSWLFSFKAGSYIIATIVTIAMMAAKCDQQSYRESLCSAIIAILTIVAITAITIADVKKNLYLDDRNDRCCAIIAIKMSIWELVSAAIVTIVATGNIP